MTIFYHLQTVLFILSVCIRVHTYTSGIVACKRPVCVFGKILIPWEQKKDNIMSKLPEFSEISRIWKPSPEFQTRLSEFLHVFRL